MTGTTPPEKPNPFRELWSYIREKFPPARAAVAAGVFLLPLLATFNVWIAENVPWVDQYVGADERQGVFLATIGAGVFLLYKWLDGRAGWEQKQVQAQIDLAINDKTPQDLPPGVLEPPPAPADTETDPAAYATAVPASQHGSEAGALDESAILSQPGDDIAESDMDHPDELERRERAELPEYE